MKVNPNDTVENKIEHIIAFCGKRASRTCRCIDGGRWEWHAGGNKKWAECDHKLTFARLRKQEKEQQNGLNR